MIIQVSAHLKQIGRNAVIYKREAVTTAIRETTKNKKNIRMKTFRRKNYKHIVIEEITAKKCNCDKCPIIVFYRIPSFAF